MRLWVSWKFFFFSSRRRHTRCGRDWSSDVCSSDLTTSTGPGGGRERGDDALSAAGRFSRVWEFTDLDDGRQRAVECAGELGLGFHRRQPVDVWVAAAVRGVLNQKGRRRGQRARILARDGEQRRRRPLVPAAGFHWVAPSLIEADAEHTDDGGARNAPWYHAAPFRCKTMSSRSLPGRGGQKPGGTVRTWE